MGVQSKKPVITVTVEELVDAQPIGRHLYRLIAICCLLMACDAYDLSALTYVAPTLMKAWAISPVAMGLILSAAMVGMLIGALILGELGDRLGRRRVIVVSSFAFALFTILAGFTRSPLELAAARFLAALGLAGITPNVIALASDMTPSRLRATAIGVIFSGFLIGGILAGFVAAYGVPRWGWQVIFWSGGGLSLLCAFAGSALIPESLVFLAASHSRDNLYKAAAALRPDLAIDPSVAIVVGQVRTAKIGIAILFGAALRWRTVWVWMLYFTCALSVFFIGLWLPAMTVQQGFSHTVASYAMMALFAGGALGSIAGGVMTDRFGFRAIAVMGLLGSLTISAIGFAQGVPALLMISFFAGSALFGSQSSLHGVVGSLYPAQIRATGAGWATGISKTGAIIGPIIGGGLLARLTPIQLFVVAGLPMLLMLACALVLSFLTREQRLSAKGNGHGQ